MIAQSVPPEQIVARIRSGDGDAEHLLVERYSRPLRALLRQRLRQSADVDDFLQDTLGLALGKIRDGEVRSPEKLGSFLMSMARNLVLEDFRRRARRRTEADSERVETAEASASGPQPDVESRVLASERASLVRDMLEEMETPRDREILQRFYLDEEEKDSICDDLGLSSLHFNRVLHRARQRYRKVFEQRYDTSWHGDPRAMMGA